MNTHQPCNCSRSQSYRRCALAVIAGLSMTQAHAAATLMDALTYGTVSGEFRYRYEWVDQEKFANKAKASTLRTQLGYLTDSYQGFTAFLQFENVAMLGPAHYNSTTNGKTTYPIVSDPTGTEVNQAFLAYEAGYDTSLKLGRQVILLDNQRWVGNAGWRQNEQSFDAFDLVNKSLPNTQITYAYLTDANRVTGDDAVNGDLRMKTHLLNVAYSGLRVGTLTGYDYLLHDENQALAGVPAASTQTVGLRLVGKQPVSGANLLYTGEFARQSDYANNASNYGLNYGLGELGATVKGITAKLGYERLAGDGTRSMQTPLATLHAFNGWADKFLSTPKDGLNDAYVSFGTKVRGIELMASYHDFSADHLSYDYGKEVDLSVGKKINKSLSLLFKYASYSGDKNSANLAADTANKTVFAKDLEKIWLQADVTF